VLFVLPFNVSPTSPIFTNLVLYFGQWGSEKCCIFVNITQSIQTATLADFEMWHPHCVSQITNYTADIWGQNATILLLSINPPPNMIPQMVKHSNTPTQAFLFTLVIRPVQRSSHTHTQPQKQKPETLNTRQFVWVYFYPTTQCVTKSFHTGA